MKNISLAGLLCRRALVLLALTPAAMAATVFTENFSSTTLVDKPNSYLGGYYGNPVNFGEWARSGPTISLSSGTLQVSSDSGYRGAAILLSPSLFPSAGAYTLSFDVVSYTGDANDTATVAVWQGSGYDMSRSSGNALILHTQTGQLQALGSASSSMLVSGSYNAAATGVTLDFNYDGVSTVALFFGATTGGYPFPTVRYDNISVTSKAVSAVPEPSAVAILALPLGLALWRRNRRA
ncbi:PEP-CTERM sorting domain-containing protein [Luteolibacter ambystomatis]|uniref:PEP-CTERM sorting domain-containing protein n=1 Tax=Luteolibacter ambystomatis TaxID=2824561 RepID=A0A975IYY8_9BACT|nr:PEP-CTERM sorting domain-containing protein [Luteolibacter ambystomatis]QUE50911.1 PEP-CTERM sorting domain-containing protein [Luteolibacter ambystomatis]